MARRKTGTRELTREEIFHFTDYLSVMFAPCPFDSEEDRRRAWEECDKSVLYDELDQDNPSDFGPGIEGMDGRCHPFPAVWYGDVEPKPKPGFHPVTPPEVGRLKDDEDE